MSDHGPGPIGTILIFLTPPAAMVVLGLVCWIIFNDEVVR